MANVMAGVTKKLKSKRLNVRRNNLIVFVLGFAVVASIALIATHATGPNVSIEPESATIASPAISCGNDANASNNGCVQFKKAGIGGQGAAYSKLGFYPCDQSVTTYSAQQVACMNNLSTWLGRTSTPKIPYIVLMTDSGSPSTMSGNGWGAVVAPGAFQTVSPKPTLVVSVPLAFGTDGCGNSPTKTTCFDNVANGSYDGQYRSLLQYFIDAGYDSNHLIIRLGWEYDGDWMPWSARNNPAQFIAAFRHVHDVMRAMSGMSTLKFDLAGDPRQTSPNSVWQSGNQTYPGDAYVDIVGMDAYSLPFSTSSCTPDTFTGNALPSLTAQRDFAIAHGKQVSYPEWGQKTNPDCANFVQDMYDWMNGLPTSGGGSLAYHSYFNIASNEGSNSSFRLYDAVNNLPLSNSLNAEAKFKTLFGN